MLCISKYLKWVKRSALWHLKATNCKKEGEAKITSENISVMVALAVLTFLTSFLMILTALYVIMKRYSSSTLMIRQLLLLSPLWKDGDCFDLLVSRRNQLDGMSCNPIKCKELTTNKRSNRDLYSPIGRIPSCKEVEILGVRDLPM